MRAAIVSTLAIVALGASAQPRPSPAKEVERRFLDGVSTESIGAIHRQVTEHPHIAGSARSMAVADRVRRELDAAGLQTEVREIGRASCRERV